MILTGITDEVSSDIDGQIAACKALGWDWIDLRTVGEANITNITEAEFDSVLEKLAQANIRVSSFCSSIANWSRTLDDSPEVDYEEFERAVGRMKKAETNLIRVMSYRPPEGADPHDDRVAREVIRRLATITRRAEEEGIVCIHENCETWGGQSYEHTLRLVESLDSPSFRLVFDTGNPFFTRDARKDATSEYQDALVFYRAVKEYIAYIHIKDGYMDGENAVFTMPGEGDGSVGEIVSELHADGYDGAFSIEPHVAVVYHDPSVTAEEQERWDSFIAYGKQTASLLQAAGYAVPAHNK